MLESTGLPPTLLVLELTESVALTDLAESARVLGALKTLGVRIALDDFGTGFSSLSHLGALPVDVVKIDRSFVQAMQDSNGASVAEAVLQIARTFNLSPVAEGVEDAEQASRLRELDCAQAQGYHFARPMPAGDLTALLTRQSAPAARLSGYSGGSSISVSSRSPAATRASTGWPSPYAFASSPRPPAAGRVVAARPGPRSTRRPACPGGRRRARPRDRARVSAAISRACCASPVATRSAAKPLAQLSVNGWSAPTLRRSPPSASASIVRASAYRPVARTTPARSAAAASVNGCSSPSTAW